MGLLDSRLRTTCVLAGVFALACTTCRRSVVATLPSAPLQAASIPNLHDAQQQVDEYIRSGRYDEEVARALAAARAWLEERAKPAVKPAGVLDIDEASPYTSPRY